VDRREARAALVTPARSAAAERLQRVVPGVEVQFDAISGAPSHIMAAGRFLARPGAAGAEPEVTLRGFIDAHADLFGHDSAALQQTRETRRDVTAHSGLVTRVWQQELDGIPLYKTILKASFTARGELVTVGSHFLAAPETAAGLAADARAGLVAQPPVDVARAIAVAAADLGGKIEAESVRAVSDPDGGERRQRFEAPGLSDLNASLCWLPMSADALRLSWDVTLMSLRLGEMFRVVVDAQTGEVLVRSSLTNDATDASYRVYADATTRKPFDSPNPMLPGTPTPSGAQPPEVPRQLVTLQSLDAMASPNGWLNDGVTETLGNNVDAHTDTDANNQPDLPRPASATRVFDFSTDLLQPPSTYRNASATHLFYINNWMHDELYRLGFTESAGNFQTDNFGRGGLGADAVQADAQDGSGTNNANMSTPGDGLPPRMQMFIFTGPTPDRDGDFDNVIVIHEYVHGLSNRLVGGGVGIGTLASAGMGEGWSDFYGLAMLADPASNQNAVYPGGSYATLQLGAMLTNAYYGIRRYPYSTDLSKNPLTFRDIDPTQASPHLGIPLSPLETASNSNPSEVHNSGEVWCIALWECRANLIAKYGPGGNQKILQLVTDGMKLAPVNPNFLQARDAIIQADLVATGGADRDELWAGFAKRGMGVSASAPSSNTTTGVVESFDLPDDLTVSPTSAFLASGPVGGNFTPATRTYTLTNTGTTALTWTAAASQPWLAVSPSGGTLAAGGTTTVIAAFNAAAEALGGGTYTAAVNFTNATSGQILSRGVRLVAGGTDYFTEIFDTSANDTDNQSWLFTPNGSPSYYGVTKTSVTAFPTDPTGGTVMTLTLDDFEQITPAGGVQVSLYGTSYPTFFVSSKAYVTMTAGTFAFTESLDSHFSLPRIAALFDDLDPSAGGTVSWRQLADRIAVTWQSVPEFGTANANSCQIEMFFDGRVRITCLAIAATDGLIGLSRGTGLPVDFTESDFSVYGAVPALRLRLTLPASATEGAGVVTGSLSVSASQAAGIVASLVSSAPGEAAVPASVILGAGQLSVNFNLTIGNDSVVDGPQPVVISGTAAGFAGIASVLTVQDNESGGTLSLSAPASATEGVGTVPGTLSVSIAPGAPLTVALSSSDTTEVQVPGGVVIPAGRTSVTFPITIVDDTIIDGAQSATITAQLAGWTSSAATASVLDSETENLALGLPPTVTEGTSATAIISIPGTRGSALTVSLVSDNPARLTVPATVSIPAGSSTASFTVTAPNNTLTDGAALATVTASAVGFAGASAPTTVLDNDVHHFAIDPIAASQIRGVPNNVTISARDVNDVFVGTFTGAVALTAAGSGGPATITPTATAAFTGGTWTGNVTVQDFANGVVLTASDGAGHTGASNAFNVGTGPLHHFGWAPIDLVQSVNLPFAVGITAQDAGNNTVTAFTGTVGLSGFAPQTSASAIVITEANPNTPDEIEFMNVGTGAVDISGWQIFVYDFATYPAPLSVFTIPLGTTCAVGQIFRLQETGTAPGTFPLFRTGGNINWTSNSGSPIAVLLRDASGTAVDFVCAAAGDPQGITVPQTIPVSQWSGAPISAPATATFGYLRTGAVDASSAADWATAAPSIGAQNAGLTLPLAVPTAVPITPVVSGNFAAGVWAGSLRVLQAATQLRLRADDGAGHVGESNAFDVLGTIHGNPQTIAVPFNTPVPITLTGIDPLNPGAALTYATATPPAHGSLSGTAPNLTYTPALGYFGSDSFTFTVANGALVSPPATVTLNVQPPPAEIVVEQPIGTPLTDGTGAVNFGTTSASGAPVSRIFTIRNVGGQPLTTSGITGDGADIADFSFPDLAGVTIPGLGSASFAVTLEATSIGVKTAALHIGSNDADENPFDIALTGTVIAAPEIVVEQPAGNRLVDGTATVSFGDAVLGVPVVKAFTIRNTGVQPLNLGSVTVVGADFAPGSPSIFTIPVGGSATLNVTFTASSTGAKAATLRVASNDLDETPFDIRLIGIGSAPPGLLRLARDINATGAGAGTTSAVVIGTTMYFAASTPDTGLELWKSDGTAAGTTLVRDINAGTGSSTPGNFRVIGTTLYFTATTAANGVELWRSDGTTAGTVLVRDIFTGTTSSNPANLTAVGSTLYFSATDSAANGIELWRSEGTTASTVLVSNINPATNASSSPANLTAIGSTLFFSATDGTTGIELWKSDGTAATTGRVSDIFAGAANSSPANFAVLNGRLFFSATNGTTGIELWTSDGTTTSLVRDIFAGATSSSPTLLVNVGGTLFFRASSSGAGVELWKSDGTGPGTVQVKDINPGAASSTPASLFAAGPGIYFAATDGANGIELWKSDGTGAGTVLVADINPGTLSSSPANFTRIANALFFSATTATGGSELWKVDVFTGITELVAEINPGAGGSAPTVLVNVGGRLVLVANDGANGAELWSSDGTTAGTSLLRDLTPGSASAAPANLRVLNGVLLFSANDGVSGQELWSSDGLPGGTVLLDDINPGAGSSSPGAGMVIGSTLYFAANETGFGTELWKSDGTPGGTVRVKDIFPGATGSNPTGLTRVGSTLYFSASDSTTNGAELWKTDGTETGTVPVANINPLANTGSAPANLTDFNGTLFFTANDGTNGIELWKSDGATAELVADINGGTANASPANLRVIGSTLFFSATSAAAGIELWKSDGATVTMIADLNPGTANGSPANLTVVGTTLFFSAITPATGTELWRSDGPSIELVEDINPGTASSTPGNFMNVNGTLFFSAFTTPTGTELWRSDGSESGTELVKDILPGINGSSLAAFANVEGVLYFAANPSGTGTELWMSDGTEPGTVQAADIRPGSLGSGPANITPIGNRLFFTATGSDLGVELWVLDLAAPDITIEYPPGTPLTGGSSTVPFGPATIGAGGEATRTFTIRNAIAGTTLTSFFLSTDGTGGADFIAGSVSAVAVGSGASATLDVIFAPSATGPRAATLRVFSNDPDEAPFDIALTGTGIAPTTLQAWRLLHFGTVAGTGAAADLADFDFDGILNLFEFGFGTDPASMLSGPSPLVITGGLGGGTIVSTGQPIVIYEPRPNGYAFAAVYTRRKDYLAVGLTYTVQFSADLAIWQSSAAVPTVLADDGTHQAVSVPYPFFVGGKKARFFRVEISLAP
jgi:ELWxxDGT repeat protein